MGTISTPDTVITFDQIFWQRYRIAKESRYTWNEITKEIDFQPNYFAPNYGYGYNPEFGDWSNLQESRWRDGELWSAFLARDISKAFPDFDFPED